MPITIMDIIVILITVFSGFLAMLRGFSREILSLLSWIGAALITYFFHDRFLFLFESYFSKPIFALICSVILVFIISLCVLFFINMKISNLIVRSTIGPIDRILGLFFGFFRGLLLCSFSVLLIMTMTRVENRPYWFENARTLPMLQLMANKVLTLLPNDLDAYIDYAEQLQHKNKER